MSLKITIGDYEVDVEDQSALPIAIDYKLEDPQNFQSKKSATAFDVEIPANKSAHIASNTFRNPGIEDMTSGKIFRNTQRCVVEENGEELLVGKAKLTRYKHNGKPISYTYNMFGDNADWLIDLNEKTLYDFIKQITLTFDKATMVASWAFDGTSEALPYVFAPVRYRAPFNEHIIAETNTIEYDDNNVNPEYLRPALSKYWILYWAFKSLGYRIQSTFMDLPFFRRQVMPWTWGAFLDSDGQRLDAHKFLSQTEIVYTETVQGQILDFELPNYIYIDTKQGGNTIQSGIFADYFDFAVTNDSHDGSFDNNDDYTYRTAEREMRWEYKADKPFGTLEANLSVAFDVKDAHADNNCNIYVEVHWFVNSAIGEPLAKQRVFEADAAWIGTAFSNIGITEVFYTATVNPGDVVIAKVFIRYYQAKLGDLYLVSRVASFRLNYFRIPLGGTILFSDYTSFQNYKILDMVAGILDEFNLSINTDATNKVVIVEPTHPYTVPGDNTIHPGYFNGQYIDWNGKEDLSDDTSWEMENFADSEKELLFAYKDDTNDGMLKTIQDRVILKLAQAKYEFSDRFQTGSKTIENRFFSPTMHYFPQQWKFITGVATQMVCIIPENISQTSERESSNTFTPKSCYYKGNVTGHGGWRFDDEDLQTIPFMFAVNYMPGGENDPVLSYTDERIGATAPINLTVNYTVNNEYLVFTGQSGLITNFYAGQVLIVGGITVTVLEVSTVVADQFSLKLNTTLPQGSVTGGTIVSGGDIMVARGLLKRFYWQRLAIMRNGQYYTTFFRLKNIDIANTFHREFISYLGDKWQLIEIKGYKPLAAASSQCYLYKWHPIEQVDEDNTFPSLVSVGTGVLGLDPLDMKYQPLLCLVSDVPL